MKRLYILRHAKSSWAQPGLGDRERPLNPRGINQMARLAVWWRAHGEALDAVLVSPSVRTRETLAGFEGALGDVEPTFDGSLYHGTMDDYLSAIWAQSGERLMVIGHNPTCDELSRWLTAPSSPAVEKLMAHHFGTATMAIFDVAVDTWTELGQASGQLVDLLRPRDLEAV